MQKRYNSLTPSQKVVLDAFIILIAFIIGAVSFEIFHERIILWLIVLLGILICVFLELGARKDK